MFENMRNLIRENTAKFMIKARFKVNIQQVGEAPQRPNILANAQPVDKASRTIKNTQKKIGRNDPCPCGSGKKYKDCCGKSE